MKTIAIEEHFSTPASSADISGPSSSGTAGQYMAEVGRKLTDLGEGRLADMDAAGIDVQVLSLSAVEGGGKSDAATASLRARDANDFLAEAIGRHSRRYAGFAAVALDSLLLRWKIPRRPQPNWSAASPGSDSLAS